MLLLAALILTLYLGFPLRHVVVSGTMHHEASVITNLVLERPVADNTLLAVLLNHERQISQFGFVESINAEIESRDTIRVEVTERSFIGCVFAEDKWWYFDSAGQVMACASRKLDGEQIPPVTGLLLSQTPQLGQQLPTTNTRAVSMLSVLATMTETNGELCPDEAIFDDDNRLVLRYGSVKVQVGSGEKLDMRLRKLEEVLNTVLNGYTGTLHLETYDGSQAGLIFDQEQN